MFFRKVLYYINPVNLFKKEKDEGINLRVMHGINKISFLMFILCLAYLIYRWVS
ncbi:MAG: hypothetical protein MK081_16175 [Flavobacteriales bacterium]|nr:hypothetical protein [Flavobacteriales bacterium]